MILSAQRVRAHSGAQGINCYHYVHGKQIVDSPVEFYCRKATLLWQHRPLPHAGNRVRSWIDVAAPDEYGWKEISGAFDALLALPVMPHAFSPADSAVAFTLDMDVALRPHWRQELLSLLAHLQSVHP